MPPQSEADAFWYLPPQLTTEQHALCSALRARLGGAGALVGGLDDDLSLLRFLKGRAWDVPKAAAMYMVCRRAWRRHAHGAARLMLHRAACACSVHGVAAAARLRAAAVHASLHAAACSAQRRCMQHTRLWREDAAHPTPPPHTHPACRRWPSGGARTKSTSWCARLSSRSCQLSGSSTPTFITRCAPHAGRSHALSVRACSARTQRL